MLPAGGRPAISCVNYTTSCNTRSSAAEDGQNNFPKHIELTGIINKPLLLHLVGCLYYFYQWCTVKQISDNETYLLIKYIRSILLRVAKRLSYIQDAWCLKFNISPRATSDWRPLPSLFRENPYLGSDVIWTYDTQQTDYTYSLVQLSLWSKHITHKLPSARGLHAWVYKVARDAVLYMHGHFCVRQFTSWFAKHRISIT